MTRKKSIEDQAAGDVQNMRHREETARMRLQEAKETEAHKSLDRTTQGSRTNEGRDTVLTILGRIQGTATVGSFAKTLSLLQLKNIKENQLYKYAKGVHIPDTKGGITADVGTWEGFCRAAGLSRSKVDEDLANLDVIGEESLEKLNRIGFGYRDLRKLRRLPDSEREAIINGEAIDMGDKEAVQSLIDDLSAKHARETGSLEKTNQNLRHELAAARQWSAGKEQKINELHAQLERQVNATPDERAADLSRELEKATRSALGALHCPDIGIGQILAWDDAPRELKHACAQTIARLRIAIDEIEKKHYLEPASPDFDDSWIKPPAVTDAIETPEGR